VYSKADRDLEAKFLMRCGADFIIYPERDAAERIAVRESSDRIFDFIGLSEGCAICEIDAPDEWVGHSVAEVGLRSRHGLNLIAARRGERLHPVLDPAYVFVKDEHVLVLGSLEDIRKATRE
jgi:potassium uptake protein ktrA